MSGVETVDGLGQVSPWVRQVYLGPFWTEQNLCNQGKAVPSVLSAEGGLCSTAAATAAAVCGAVSAQPHASCGLHQAACMWRWCCSAITTVHLVLVCVLCALYYTLIPDYTHSFTCVPYVSALTSNSKNRTRGRQ